jgi:hypothetical protein
LNPQLRNKSSRGLAPENDVRAGFQLRRYHASFFHTDKERNPVLPDEHAMRLAVGILQKLPQHELAIFIDLRRDHPVLVAPADAMPPLVLVKLAASISIALKT